jgi:hypothetical protein
MDESRLYDIAVECHADDVINEQPTLCIGRRNAAAAGRTYPGKQMSPSCTENRRRVAAFSSDTGLRPSGRKPPYCTFAIVSTGTPFGEVWVVGAEWLLSDSIAGLVEPPQ